ASWSRPTCSARSGSRTTRTGTRNARRSTRSVPPNSRGRHRRFRPKQKSCGLTEDLLTCSQVFSSVKDRALASLPRALDRELPVPLYHQLKSQLLKRIEGGELKAHARLETEDQLAAAYRVSKATVRQALGELVHAGYLRREQGRGTFVADPRVDQG